MRWWRSFALVTPGDTTVVDDQPAFRRHLCRLLTHAGLTVVGEAGDIPEAEALVQALQPDLAVVDVMLPGVNLEQLWLGSFSAPGRMISQKVRKGDNNMALQKVLLEGESLAAGEEKRLLPSLDVSRCDRLHFHITDIKKLWLMTLVLALTLALLPGRRIARANTYTVTSTDNSGFGTLRQAITDANNDPGPDIIEFNISVAGNYCDFQSGVCTISLTSPLPALTDDNTTINGYTQPGAQEATDTTPATLKIVIRGSSAGDGADGLTIESANNVIKGVAIRSFSSNGIHIHGSGATGNIVSGNTIGGGNDGHGIRIDGGAQNNTIGGDTPAERNVIYNNDGSGVYISGSGTTGNTVSGNYIGIYSDGTTAVGNKHGVTIGDGAQNNTVGGSAPGERNVISGNDGDGVRIHSGTVGNTVSGNTIGTDAIGTAALGNGAHGVYIFSDTQNNTVGPGNVIAHNGGDGVTVSGCHVSGNTVTQNSIFSNTLGINLAYNANGNVAAPVIVNVTSGSVNILGTACPNCIVEVFENGDADGEGKTFLGETTAGADGDFTLTVSSMGNPYLTATATDPVSGTSEFSEVFPATGAGGPENRLVFLPAVLRGGGSGGCPSPSGPTVHNGGHLTADETWRAADGPHQVMGTITVNEGATLTIEPCAEVQLAEDVRIVVRGALVAEGAAGQPILFTALDDEPWRSIHIEYPATGSFAYATLENGGSDFVNDDGASLVAEVDKGEYSGRILRQFVKVNHITVKNSAGFGILMDDWYAGFTDDSAHLNITGSGKSDPNHDHPIHISAPALGTLPSGRYTGNAVDAIWVRTRTIISDVTVHDRGVPYHIVSDIYVEPESETAPDPTLTLRPGVEMHFDPDTVLHVGNNWLGGALVAEGTASQPVTFKAWDSDNPWNSIEVRYPATVSLTHVVMQDGGAERINYEGALLFVEADDAGQGLDQVIKIVKVDHVTLKDSGGYGIFMGGLVGFTDDSTNLTITGCGQDGPDPDGRFVQPVRLTAMAMGTLPSGQYTGNAADVILVFGDDGIWRDVTVRDLGVPYQLWSHHFAIDVYADPADGPAPTLTIEAGVEMRFEEGERLNMGSGWPSYHPGGLQILGTAANPVVLTSAAAAPAAGDWAGVEFDAPPAGATNSITHARIAYAGGDNGHANYSCGVGDHGDDGAVTLFEWRPDSAFVTSSEIRHSAANGFVRGWDGEGGPDFTKDTDNTFTDIAECDQTNPDYPECQDCG